MKWLTSDLRTVQSGLHLTDAQLSQLLGRTPDAVRSIRRHLGERKEEQHRWSSFEIGMLKESLHMTDAEIARILQRTVSEVKSARNRYGLKKK